MARLIVPKVNVELDASTLAQVADRSTAGSLRLFAGQPARLTDGEIEALRVAGVRFVEHVAKKAPVKPAPALVEAPKPAPRKRGGDAPTSDPETATK